MSEIKHARKYKSNIINKVKAGTSPELKIEISTKMNLSAKIADLLELKGISKGELAAKVGKQPSEISKWLSGTHNFTVDTLSEIAFALNVCVSDLFAPVQSEIINRIRIVTTSKAELSGVRYLTPVSKPYQPGRNIF